MRILIFITSLIVLSNGWWENGHMLAAQIAKLDLKSRNKTIYDRVDELIQAMNPLVGRVDYDFVESAVWADDIKDSAMSFWNDWHFYDRPLNPTGVFITQDPAANFSNSVIALQRALSELKNDNGAITMQKCIFVRYILHVIGDMHQPLHNVAFFNKSYPSPLGDMGGNKENVIDLKNRTIVFHAYWDQGCQYLQDPDKNFIERPLNDTAKAYLENWGKDLMKQYPRSTFKDRLTLTDLYDWTRESYNLAKNFSYPFIYNTSQITNEYQTQCQEMVKSQVTLAGYRLSDFLVRAFANYSPSSNRTPRNYNRKPYQPPNKIVRHFQQLLKSVQQSSYQRGIEF